MSHLCCPGRDRNWSIAPASSCPRLGGPKETSQKPSQRLSLSSSPSPSQRPSRPLSVLGERQQQWEWGRFPRPRWPREGAARKGQLGRGSVAGSPGWATPSLLQPLDGLGGGSEPYHSSSPCSPQPISDEPRSHGEHGVAASPWRVPGPAKSLAAAETPGG